MRALFFGLGYHHVGSVLRKRWHEPSEYQRGRNRAGKLRRDESGSIGRADASERIGGGTCRRDEPGWRTKLPARTFVLTFASASSGDGPPKAKLDLKLTGMVTAVRWRIIIIQG